MSRRRARAAVVGLAGPFPTPAEFALLRELPPAGVILFARNCWSPAQVAELTGAVRAALDAPELPILIDQEGGRVARLGPPAWPAIPAAGRLGSLAGTAIERARDAVRLAARLIAHELRAVGVTVDCAPVLDVRRPETTDAIGDRAFADEPRLVAALGRAFVEGLEAGGVAPVIKHLPGHGRARVDSHAELPVVDASREELERDDFAPFQALAPHVPFAMTAHVVYTALDPERPATLSPRVIDAIIRGAIGFRGILLSDDLAMQALTGTPAERATGALAAGCDLALFCPGRLEDSAAVLAAVPPVTDRVASLLAGLATRYPAPEPLIAEAATARLAAMLEIA